LVLSEDGVFFFFFFFFFFEKIIQVPSRARATYPLRPAPDAGAAAAAIRAAVASSPVMSPASISASDGQPDSSASRALSSGEWVNISLFSILTAQSEFYQQTGFWGTSIQSVDLSQLSFDPQTRLIFSFFFFSLFFAFAFAFVFFFFFFFFFSPDRA
jgi:hypothetical protein